jgi:hypothetical protein
MRTGRRLFSWFRSGSKPDKILEDRKYLEARARRLLNNYLGADSEEKQRYYELIAGAAAACRPGITDPRLQDPDLAARTAEAAFKVVMTREHQAIDTNDQLATFITDAYATVAVAYRRASTSIRLMTRCRNSAPRPCICSRWPHISITDQSTADDA